MKTREISYAELKTTYLTVKAYLSDIYDANNIHLHSKIEKDLGFWGDENYLLLVEFAEKYQLDFKKFDYSQHFDNEGCNPFLILFLPFIFSYNLLHFFFPKMIPPLFAPKLDLTMGDLVASLTEGEFCLRKDIRYTLKITHSS